MYESGTELRASTRTTATTSRHAVPDIFFRLLHQRSLCSTRWHSPHIHGCPVIGWDVDFYVGHNPVSSIVVVEEDERPVGGRGFDVLYVLRVNARRPLAGVVKV